MIDFTKEELEWIKQQAISKLRIYPNYQNSLTLPDCIKKDFNMIQCIKDKIEKHQNPNILLPEWGGIARCMTSDGRNINMADELNRLEEDKIEKYNEKL